MTVKKEVKVYKTTGGKAPFSEWQNALKDKIIRARIDRRLERLMNGNYGDFKFVGEGVFEMRLQFGAGYRIYFGEINHHIVLLLCAGDKSSQAKDIRLAQQYWQEFKKR